MRDAAPRRAQVNFMMEDRNMPQELRVRVRMFFHQSKELQRVEGYTHLGEMMSMALRNEVAGTSNRPWLEKVWYFRGMTDAFICEVCQKLHLQVFAPREFLPPRTLYIMRCGISAKDGRPMSKHSVWGEEFIVEDEWLPSEAIVSACALTYVQVFRLNHDQLMQVLESGDHPEATTALLKARRWIIYKWAFVDWARRVLDQYDAGVQDIPLVEPEANGLRPNGVSVAIDAPAVPSPRLSLGSPSSAVGAEPVFAGAGDASVGELARAVQAMRATQTQQMQLLQSLGKQLERLNSEVMKKSDVNLFMPVDSEA